MPAVSRRRALRTPIVGSGLLLAAATAALGLLAAARPHLTGSPSSWAADDLADATTWLVAFVCAAWLAVTTLMCLLALARGRHALASRIAGIAPPLARRVLQTALDERGRHCSRPRPTRPGPRRRSPCTLDRADASRRSASPRPPTTSRSCVPRSPSSRPRPPSPRRHRPRRWRLPRDEHPRSLRRRSCPSPPRPPASRAPARSHVVRAGDNLWLIARAEVTRVIGATPPEQQVARVLASRDRRESRHAPFG